MAGSKPMQTKIVKMRTDSKGAQKLFFCKTLIGYDGIYCPHCCCAQYSLQPYMAEPTPTCEVCGKEFRAVHNPENDYWLCSEIHE